MATSLPGSTISAPCVAAPETVLRPERRRPRTVSVTPALGDADLVIAICAQAPGSLEEAYRRCGAAVAAVARRLLRNATLAEDVTQEVFLRLWRAPERFDEDKGSLHAFLIAECHGRAVDLIRAETRRRAREVNHGTIDLRGADGGDLADEVCGASTAALVRSTLHELPPLERQAISLAYFHGNTYGEVARLLGTPEGTVKSRIRSGLWRLRAELGDSV